MLRILFGWICFVRMLYDRTCWSGFSLFIGVLVPSGRLIRVCGARQ